MGNRTRTGEGQQPRDFAFNLWSFAGILSYVPKQGSDHWILECWMEEPYDYDAEALQGFPPRYQRAATVYERRVSGSAGEQRSFLLPAGNSGDTQLTYAEQKEAKGVLKQ